MGVPLSNFLKSCIVSARKISNRYKNGYLGTEHVLWGMLTENGFLTQTLTEMSADVDSIVMKLETSMEDYKNLSDKSGPYTPRLRQILDRAEQNSLKKLATEISESALLKALLSTGYCSAVRAMGNLSFQFEDIEESVEEKCRRQQGEKSIPAETDELPSLANPIPLSVPSSLYLGGPARQQIPGKQLYIPQQMGAPLSAVPAAALYDRDLSALARSGSLDEIYGRQSEIAEICRCLARSKSNNPVISGKRGTGRTSIAEGLALYLKTEAAPAMLRYTRILELTRSKYLQIFGDSQKAEERLKQFLHEISYPGTLLVLDGIMELADEERVTWNILSMLNEIKHLVDEQKIRALFITTPEGYQKSYTKDATLQKNCEKIDIEPLNTETSIKILKKEKQKLENHHQVAIEPEVLEAAAELSEEFIKEGCLPEKALNVLDEACAMVSLQDRGDVTIQDVEQAISRRSGLPIEKVTKKINRLKNMEEEIAREIIGQDYAIKKVCARIRLFMTGLNQENRPLGIFFFAGPTGVGKTELAKVIARQVFGSDDKLQRFDMSEYSEHHEVARLIGAPPGYIGYQEEGQLTGAVKRNPHCVILLDEFEKAHERIFNIFLQVFDAGRLTDGRGNIVDFRNTLIIMTSNLGARLAEKNYYSGTHIREDYDEEQKNELVDILRERFSMEFINRLDDIILFNTLTQPNIKQICSLIIQQWVDKLKRNGITLEISDDLLLHLCSTSYNPDFGVRNMRRVIENLLIIPLSQKLLDEEVPSGSIVEANIRGEQVLFRSTLFTPEGTNMSDSRHYPQGAPSPEFLP